MDENPYKAPSEGEHRKSMHRKLPAYSDSVLWVVLFLATIAALAIAWVIFTFFA
jgi:hypothetical protein